MPTSEAPETSRTRIHRLEPRQVSCTDTDPGKSPKDIDTAVYKEIDRDIDICIRTTHKKTIHGRHTNINNGPEVSAVSFDRHARNAKPGHHGRVFLPRGGARDCR